MQRTMKLWFGGMFSSKSRRRHTSAKVRIESFEAYLARSYDTTAFTDGSLPPISSGSDVLSAEASIPVDLATDNAGNAESAPTSSQVTTTVNLAVPALTGVTVDDSSASILSTTIDGIPPSLVVVKGAENSSFAPRKSLRTCA
jgi:hypothetical protein